LQKRSGRDLAVLLLGKARGDEITLQRLLDAEGVPDESLGFHAQQAAEKLLKAALACRDIEYEYSHDLEYLFELLQSNGLEPPVAEETSNGSLPGRPSFDTRTHLDWIHSTPGALCPRSPRFELGARNFYTAAIPKTPKTRVLTTAGQIEL
jgi:hypothetical protein